MQDPRTPEGLYDPQYEHDACGVGFICNVDGTRTHDIVRKGLEILINLEHRGACGCDERTGDGVGILIQLPDAFFREKLPFALPAPGYYAAGFAFLPTEADDLRYCKDQIERVVAEEGQVFLGWRTVPVNPAHVGQAAQEVMPTFWQFFVQRGTQVVDGDAFERKLYVIRKVLEHRLRGTNLRQKSYFYLPSLSARTIVYKGMLTVDQLGEFFPDLDEPSMESALAMVHSRFSTNTFPQWKLAHPFRFISHNGEINTLRGNVNWMKARESLFASPLFGDDISKLQPVLEEGASDSATLDNAVELLVHTGRSLPHAMLMLVPEAWERHERMSEEKKAFYEYHACLMEPWDGPATIPFTDGRYIGAVLDRNGLRPSRYTVTKDGVVVLSSETGVLDIDPADVAYNGRLQPGKMFLVDLEEGRIISDDEVKSKLSRRRPYREWLDAHRITLDGLPSVVVEADRRPLRQLQQLFGYTLEDERVLLPPMMKGKEALGSMGDDTPLAVLSDRPRLLYDYFRQLFAQVTNPPLDAIREALVTSLTTALGNEPNLLDETPLHGHQVRLEHPILTDEELAKIEAVDDGVLRALALPMVFDASKGGLGLRHGLDHLCLAAAEAVRQGYTILVLSDRDADAERAPIPALLATAAVHHHLIREGLRTQSALVVESGEPREVHHFALLIGYGASAVNPYLALRTIAAHPADHGGEGAKPLAAQKAVTNYFKAIGDGILKVMSKMGISTLQSYQGAQIFEAVGLSSDLVERYFTGTATRLEGIGIEVIAQEAQMRHARAFPEREAEHSLELEAGGRYLWRRNGEHHLFNPLTIAHLQHAVRQNRFDTYAQYAELINDQTRRLATLRGLLDFRTDHAPVPLHEVEPWTEIVKRFKTGAMSYGSLSQEAHETLAVAMNTLGGRSNTGEGGEDPERYVRGNPKRSRIKQVASGRFGVTIGYLTSADEIQIKMAQGAKPGEGGQLPAEKVYPWIARTRHSTPYVGLISPPPHHDIYSIEDLAQLIHDLKNANPKARISVKLVSEVGVGTIAAGVTKGKADVVLISGHDGGTGASPQTSIAHAGLPWELGLSETHQTLVRNGLRSRIKVECDGQLKTGRDVAVACLLGADEFGFATAPLVAMGCIMMRKCHLNTCPVGVATQDPELRKRFVGQPEHVVNFLHFVAEELRQIMARLGFRTVDEMVGRVDRLQKRADIDHWKAKHLDLSRILFRPSLPAHLSEFSTDAQDHGLEGALDHWVIEQAYDAIENASPVALDVPINNTNRTFGTMLSAQVSERYGEDGLREDTILLNCTGSAGQSFMAFGARGLTARLEGDANDYFGKGLSGAKLIMVPPRRATFVPKENVIIGNVALYGATSGEVFVRGQAGERFAVRNSGAYAVVEGVGDHGCEYMTGGRVVVLGPTGRNFAAGMSGGIAYVLDGTRDFRKDRCNREMVELIEMSEAEADDLSTLRYLLERHAEYTGSTTARWALDNWEAALPEFVKVMPVEYRNALLRLEHERAASPVNGTIAA